MNLIPKKSCKSPNYWCTWSAQAFGGDMNRAKKASVNEGFDGLQGDVSATSDFINEESLFGSPGWVNNVYPEIQKDLYFMLDQGWDMEYNVDINSQRWKLGAMALPKERFPSYTSGSHAENLKNLNNKIKEIGWRGAGLWICAQAYGDGKDGVSISNDDTEKFWRERARWSNYAGIEYWKVDWGKRCEDAWFRSMLTRVAREEAPDLIVEHGRNSGPINDSNPPWNNDVLGGTSRFKDWGNVLREALLQLSFSDILRTYDVTVQLSVSTTMDRVSAILEKAAIAPGMRGMINCEDELYLGAALGCTVGIMRFPMWADFKGYDNDACLKLDEAVRAIHWHRIAPPYGANENSTIMSEKLLHDKWIFKPEETWASWIHNKEVTQIAPAITARGMELPIVEAEGEEPYVVASKNPNGAVSVATLRRTFVGKPLETPLANITINAGDSDSPVGIFGEYASLTLKFENNIENKQIWAQDLMGNKAVEITGRVHIGQKYIKLSGELINEIGLSAGTKNDKSQPGLVLILE